MQVKIVGRLDGPTKRNGQKTFVVVFSAFLRDGSQAVHEMANGQQVPLVWTSYPIDTDERSALLL